MANVNRVILAGNLTRDPELRQVAGDHTVCHLGLGINRTWTDSSGQRQEEATFVEAEAWGRTAEVIEQYVHKGDPLLIEGRLKLDQWEDQEGARRSRLKVVIESAQFLSTRGAADSSEAPGPGRRAEAPQAPAGRPKGRPQPDRSSQRRPMATATR